MIYDVDKYADISTEATCEENDITIAEDSNSLIFTIFTKNMYSNPIGSVVREITSNCFDSHIEAGVNTPVLIKMYKDNETNTTYLSFNDYGMGISPERMKSIFSVLFKSTKRADNSQIGGFGLGSKSPLAYKRYSGLGEAEYDNSYFIITYYNGIKYIYNIYESAKNPKYTLLHSEPTTEHNGTEVRIPVLEKDINTFERELNRQLYYFENIYFEGLNDEFNDYKIIKANSFLYRGNTYSNNIHVCLGKVAYPIDYSALGLNSSDYSLPLAIKLNIGDINVSVSRESIDYSEKTIKLLKSKLEEVKAEVKTLLQKQYENVTTLEDYFKVKNKFGTLYFNNGLSINVGNILSVTDINYENFKYKNLKTILKDIQLFKLLFNSTLYGKKTKTRRHSRSNNYFDGSYEEILNKNFIYYLDEPLQRNRLKSAYIKSIHETYFIVEKLNIRYLKTDLLVEYLNTSLITKKDDQGNIHLNELGETLLELQNDYFEIIKKYFKDYNSIEVPEDFKLERIASKKNVTSKELRNTKIAIKFINLRSKYSINLSTLFDFNMPIFYGTQEDENKLFSAYKCFETLFDKNSIISHYSEYNNNLHFNGKKKILFIMLSKTNAKYMQYCKKAYHIDTFYHKMLYRKKDIVVNYFNSEVFIEKYNNLSHFYTSENFHLLNEDWGKTINKLRKHYNKVTNNRNSDIKINKCFFQNYIDLSNPIISKEDEKMLKDIENLNLLKEANKEILNVFDYPNDFYNNKTLREILKKVMLF